MANHEHITETPIEQANGIALEIDIIASVVRGLATAEMHGGAQIAAENYDWLAGCLSDRTERLQVLLEALRHNWPERGLAGRARA